jgi:hypothetical protein
MIRRTNDFNYFSDDVLKKIAKVIENKENNKLYDVYDNEDKARLVKAELKVKGIHSTINKKGDKYEVIINKNESILLDEAEKSGQFKKIAWGRYSFQRESGIGMFNYDFNDGSIWRVSQDEHGNAILIKEVDDEDEDNVIRNSPSQTNVKVASSNKFSFVNKETMSRVASVMFGPQNEKWMNMILSSDSSYSIMEKLNLEFDNIVNQKIASLNITSDKDIKELKKLIFVALFEEIDSMEKLDSLCNEYIQYKIKEAGKQRKYFS